ncbi:MAG: hypothetical protein JRC77_02860 [Deltaproteobacteria bacterium]|nr:hypothetical protein [Deltaproteobacteria bacterium]
MLKTFVGLLSVFVISFGLMITPAMAEEAATEESPSVDAAPPEGEAAAPAEETTEEETKTEEAAE